MNPFLLAAFCLTSGMVNLSAELPAAYHIEARLDTSMQELSGFETIDFYNPTSDTLNSLCFHLYPNAFTDTSSVLSLENRQIRESIRSGNTSSLRVDSVSLWNMPIDPASVEYQGTLMYLRLPTPLLPQSQVRLSLNFKLKIPRVISRFGRDQQGNYLFSHFLPILCGYQNGRLVEFEYHANSEFFSNFASYDVTLKIPAGFAIGSTGELSLISKDSVTTIWHAVADTVIDFAFACGPNFDVQESEMAGIKLRYLLRKEHQKSFAQINDMTRYSLQYCSDKFFPYAYRTFTVLDFDAGAMGMELPGMITLEYPDFAAGGASKTLLNLAIAHETVHEWFYAMVATNEAEEPWLDEGVTSYVTARIMESGGDSLSQFTLLGYKTQYNNFERLLALFSKAEWPINLKSWEYPNQMAYNTAVYNRSAVVFSTLEGYLGRGQFDAALQVYAEAFRFRHPTSDDFLTTLSNATGSDLSDFNRQFIAGSARLDYSVRSLDFHLLPNTDSIHGKQYEINLTLARELDGVLPQKVAVMLEDGSVIDTTWDGQMRLGLFTLTSYSRPVGARLDPHGTYPLDENISNNSLYLKSFGSRLMSFEWDNIFTLEFLLALLL